ncbi:glutathione peroxidase [Amnibacterium sp. CER49]|uniref:glutathione peroxidase n=1 Tax=Amnibacterium sp. CER49 TaxID=3039161 RepID=UPI002449F540|nr:glutathione peroxidase [Amnibacterium sp. CER49]MDH2443767.1 glutathione peroxidase [Amnibacterium sp. CER49]
MSLHDVALTTIDGRETSLAEYAGETILVVNVASRCGLTPQYEQLEALQRRYAHRGFTVLGFPSDQFAQELDSEAAIAEYCSTTWGVSFPMFARVAVNGQDRHPFFAELTKAADLDGEAGDVRWNFEKFLLTPDGRTVRFRSAVRPDDSAITDRIEAALRSAA